MSLPRRKKKTGPRARKHATHMLESMVTHEVSLVTAAANNRNFLYKKSRRLVMPAAYKEAALDALLDHISDCAKLAQLLGQATVDDTVGVDSEILRTLRDAARSAQHAAAVMRPREAA